MRGSWADARSIVVQAHDPVIPRLIEWAYVSQKKSGASLSEIQTDVSSLIGPTSPSSVRSYLNLNAESTFDRTSRGRYVLREAAATPPAKQKRFRSVAVGRATLVQADCFQWLKQQPDNSIHAVVTDPPYGLVEYEPEQQEKMRNGNGAACKEVVLALKLAHNFTELPIENIFLLKNLMN